MNKRVFISAVVLAALSLSMASTMARFTTTQPAAQVITTGSIQLKLHRSSPNSSILPGSTVDHEIKVENTGANPAYIRIACHTTADDGNLPGEDCIQLAINQSDWTKQGDYYYYNHPLPPGTTSVPLCQTVTFDLNTLDNRYLGKHLDLQIQVFGVQAQNNGSTVWDAIGWPQAS